MTLKIALLSAAMVVLSASVLQAADKPVVAPAAGSPAVAATAPAAKTPIAKTAAVKAAEAGPKAASVVYPYTYKCAHCGLNITIKSKDDLGKSCEACACGMNNAACKPKTK